MEEYIDRKKLKADRDYYEPYGFTSVSCEQIDSLPKADVVERSKIDEAIEEIEKMVAMCDVNDLNDLNAKSNYEHALEILKRNIGE